MAVQFLLGFGTAAIVSYAAWRFHALDAGGTVAAVLAGTFIFGLGGIGPSAALIVFFITGSVLSSLPTGSRRSFRRNRRDDEPLLLKEEIGGGYARNWRQVAANGGVPLAAMLAAHFVPNHPTLFLDAFYGAIAAMCADSWGTEIGTRFGSSTLDILTGSELPMGQSGGISLRGMAGSIAGAGAIALTAAWAGKLSATAMLAILLAGTFGAICDSILGSSFQAKYRHAGGNTIFENPGSIHNGRQPLLVFGYRKVTNNAVNLAASAIGALIIVVLLYFP